MFTKFLLIILISFSAFMASAAELLPVVKQRFFDANGAPLAAGKLYSYEANSMTPKTTYNQRSALPGNANTNPVILDANGEANVWIDSGYYKFILKDSADVTQWTQDSVSIPLEASLASAFWRDVVYITFTDSPYTITSAMNGKLISVNSTAGAVVINMPEASSLILPFNIGVKLETGSNSVTVNRTGTDTIDGATTKLLNSLNAGAQFIADIDQAPDDWTVIDIGTVADGAISTVKLLDANVTRAKLAIGAVAVPNRVTTAISYAVLTSDDEIYVTATATITLLAANAVGARPVTIINAGTGVVTIARSGSDTIIGETSQQLQSQYDAVTFFPDGTSKYYVK